MAEERFVTADNLFCVVEKRHIKHSISSDWLRIGIKQQCIPQKGVKGNPSDMTGKCLLLTTTYRFYGSKKFISIKKIHVLL